MKVLLLACAASSDAVHHPGTHSTLCFAIIVSLNALMLKIASVSMEERELRHSICLVFSIMSTFLSSNFSFNKLLTQTVT